MKYNMLENAMDSLNESIEYYRSGKEYNDERAFKFCILLLSHCAELLLKEILYRQHEVLIYENIDNIKKEDNKTIGFRLALIRVSKICKINLGRYSNYLSELSDIRNKIQHFEFTISEDLCTKIITASFSAIEYIVIHIFNTTFNNFDDVITSEQIDYLHEDNEAYTKRKQDIANDITDHKLIRIGVEYIKSKYLYTPCPNCEEETLVEDQGEIICKFCGLHYESTGAMYDYDYNCNCIISEHMSREIGKRKNIFYNVYDCKECEEATVVYLQPTDEWVCLSCGEKFGTTYCTECGDSMPNCEYSYTFAQSYTDTEDYMYLCNRCGKRLMNSEYSCEYEIN